MLSGIIVGLIFVVHCCLFVGAMLVDKRNTRWCRPVDMMDNDPEDRELYLVTVYTGCRLPGLGSSSPVTITIRGELGATLPHILESWTIPVLQFHAANVFLVRHYMDIGQLEEVQLWLSDPRSRAMGYWLLSGVDVEHVQSGKIYQSVDKLPRWLYNRAPDRTLTLQPCCKSFSSSISRIFREYYGLYSTFGHLPWKMYLIAPRYLLLCSSIALILLMCILMSELPLYTSVGQNFSDIVHNLTSVVIGDSLIVKCSVVTVILWLYELVMETILRFIALSRIVEPIYEYKTLIDVLHDPSLMKKLNVSPHLREKTRDLLSNYHIKHLVFNHKLDFNNESRSSSDQLVAGCSDVSVGIKNLNRATPSMLRLVQHEQPEQPLIDRLNDLIASDDGDKLVTEPFYPKSKWHSMIRMFDVDTSKMGEYEMSFPDKHILFRLMMMRYYDEFITSWMRREHNLRELEQMREHAAKTYNPVVEEDQSALVEDEWTLGEEEMDYWSKLDINQSEVQLDEFYDQVDEGLTHDITRRPTLAVSDFNITLLTSLANGDVTSHSVASGSGNEDNVEVETKEMAVEKRYFVANVMMGVLLDWILLISLVGAAIFTKEHSLEEILTWVWLAGCCMSFHHIVGQLIKISVLSLIDRVLFVLDDVKLTHIDKQRLMTNKPAITDVEREILQEAHKWMRQSAVYKPPTAPNNVEA